MLKACVLRTQRLRRCDESVSGGPYSLKIKEGDAVSGGVVIGWAVSRAHGRDVQEADCLGCGFV